MRNLRYCTSFNIAIAIVWKNLSAGSRYGKLKARKRERKWKMKKINLPGFITTKSTPIRWIIKFGIWKTTKISYGSTSVAKKEDFIEEYGTYWGAVRGIKPVKAGSTGITPRSIIRPLICFASSNCVVNQFCDNGPPCFCRFPIRCLESIAMIIDVLRWNFTYQARNAGPVK